MSVMYRIKVVIVWDCVFFFKAKAGIEVRFFGLGFSLSLFLFLFLSLPPSPPPLSPSLSHSHSVSWYGDAHISVLLSVFLFGTTTSTRQIDLDRLPWSTVELTVRCGTQSFVEHTGIADCWLAPTSGIPPWYLCQDFHHTLWLRRQTDLDDWLRQLHLAITFSDCWKDNTYIYVNTL